mmetsp:Transcript_82674/g.229408  ORF Transcript_82674/g.229408 Transcript_82674/m.229408 type:complete len:427 (-) Transcript_82674:1267-2547(-)
MSRADDPCRWETALQPALVEASRGHPDPRLARRHDAAPVAANVRAGHMVKMEAPMAVDDVIRVPFHLAARSWRGRGRRRPCSCAGCVMGSPGRGWLRGCCRRRPHGKDWKDWGLRHDRLCHHWRRSRGRRWRRGALHRSSAGAADLHDHLQGIMVTATVAKVRIADHGGRRKVAEDVVDATVHDPVEEMLEPLPQHAHRRRGRGCVEVAGQDHSIARLSVARDQLQEVVGRGRPAARAARVDRCRAVVVHEEQHLARLGVPQTEPLRSPHTKVLVLAVLRDVGLPRGEKRPRLLEEGHANCPLAPEGVVPVCNAGLVQHVLRIFALLEAHDVEGGGHGALDEPEGLAPQALSHVDQVPPVEVVRQHLDLKRRARHVSRGHLRNCTHGARGVPERGALLWWRTQVRQRTGVGLQASTGTDWHRRLGK